MGDEPETPISDHLEDVAERHIKRWLRVQRYRLNKSENEPTLKGVIISAYIEGLLDGAVAQSRTDIGMMGRANNIEILHQMTNSNE